MAYPLLEVVPSGADLPWLGPVVEAFASVHVELDSRNVARPTRTAAEAREMVRSPLSAVGFELGVGPRGAVDLPTGTEARKTFAVDSFHAGHGVVLEIDAGRAAQSNTAYRAILRAALLREVRHLVLAVPINYAYSNKGRRQVTEAFAMHVELVKSIEASTRLDLPLESMTVLGW